MCYSHCEFTSQTRGEARKGKHSSHSGRETQRQERRGPITGAPGIGPCTKGSGSRALLVSHTLNLQPLKPRIGMSLRMDIVRLHADAEFAGFG